MRRCVWSRNLVNEEAMARVGPQRRKKKKKKKAPVILSANRNVSQVGTS